MTLFYMSIYLLFWMAPFVLRTRREFRALVITVAVAIFLRWHRISPFFLQIWRLRRHERKISASGRGCFILPTN